jgi:hypothetical protein
MMSLYLISPWLQQLSKLLPGPHTKRERARGDIFADFCEKRKTICCCKTVRSPMSIKYVKMAVTGPWKGGGGGGVGLIIMQQLVHFFTFCRKKNTRIWQILTMHLKGQYHEIFASCFFHESSFSNHPKITLGHIRFF